MGNAKDNQDFKFEIRTLVIVRMILWVAVAILVSLALLVLVVLIELHNGAPIFSVIPAVVYLIAFGVLLCISNRDLIGLKEAKLNLAMASKSGRSAQDCFNSIQDAIHTLEIVGLTDTNMFCEVGTMLSKHGYDIDWDAELIPVWDEVKDFLTKGIIFKAYAMCNSGYDVIDKVLDITSQYAAIKRDMIEDFKQITEKYYKIRLVSGITLAITWVLVVVISLSTLGINSIIIYVFWTAIIMIDFDSIIRYVQHSEFSCIFKSMYYRDDLNFTCDRPIEVKSDLLDGAINKLNDIRNR